MKPHTTAAKERERGPEGIRCSFQDRFPTAVGILAEVPLFAGELLGKRWPGVSLGRGFISSDVALLGILRFTGEPGGGRATEVGISGRGLLHRAQTDPQ